MKNCMLTVPMITRCGLFDFKLKFGTLAASPPRAAESFELELPVEKGGISNIDGNTYPILPTRLLCVKPGQLRHTKAPFRCYYIHIESDGGEVCRILSSLPDSISVTNSQPYIELFQKIAMIRNGEHPNHAFSLSCYFLKLIQMLCLEVSNAEAVPPEHPRCTNTKAIVDAIAWMDAHLSERITLQQIAKEVFLSPIYFRTLFIEQTGLSPHIYILNRRLEFAKQLLSCTRKSMAEIVAECGFSSQSYFGQVFRKNTGYTPNAYRIMVNNQYP